MAAFARFFILFGLLAACKILPNTMRSDLKNSPVMNLIDKDSVRFVRTVDGTSGDLSFKLKERYNCRVQYWAENLNGQPSPQAPLAIDCPNDGLRLEHALTIENITPGVPLNFRIFVWPRNQGFVSNFYLDFPEETDYRKVSSNHIVVARYLVPRNSNEIYSYQFSKVTTLSEVKDSLAQSLSKRVGTCVNNSGDNQLPFPRFKSAEDEGKRPLHGLAKVSTDGFGQSVATVHRFFNTRLNILYDAVDWQQNWKWNYEWEGQRKTFETYPPGYIASLKISNSEQDGDVLNRFLGNAIPTFEINQRALGFELSVGYPTELSSVQVNIKKSDASQTLLRCDFSVKDGSITIPEKSFGTLPPGEYLVTLILETNQIQAKIGESAPPWLITTQDWTNFKINKRL